LIKAMILETLGKSGTVSTSLKPKVENLVTIIVNNPPNP